MATLENLKLKAENHKAKMPSIKSISKLLTDLGIKHFIREKTNVVEYRSKGRRYVNSRHNGKTGLCLTIADPFLELDSSDSYYSHNTQYFAIKLVEIIKNHKDQTK